MTKDANAAGLPLAGVRVIDFTQVMLGPCCTQVLGDYGADVIKIEREKIGDLSRWSLGSDPDGLDNPVFSSLNRNKRSATFDVKSETGRDQLRRLIKGADVVVNNFRPGVMERLGLGYGDIKKLNSRIIYAVGTGYGTDGPYKHKGGQDVLAQAMSGAMARRADETMAFSIYPTAIADYAAGMHLVQGILLALLQRGQTGEGQQVEVSLFNSMLAMQMQEAATLMMRGDELNWAAMPLTGVFKTTDSAIVVVGAFKENPLKDICQAFGIADMSEKPQFADLDAQRLARAELQAVFAENFAKNTTQHWVDALEGVDILCAPVRSLAEALADPQTAFNQMIVDLPDRASGPVRLVGSPISMSAAPLKVRLAPPSLGEHTNEVIAELDLAPAAE